MAQPESPVVQQRRLRAELKRSREQIGMTRPGVAEVLDWSPSKVIRLESGAVIISPPGLITLLSHYGITDPKCIETLVEVAQASRNLAWWDECRPYGDAQFMTFHGYQIAHVIGFRAVGSGWSSCVSSFPRSRTGCRHPCGDRSQPGKIAQAFVGSNPGAMFKQNN